MDYAEAERFAEEWAADWNSHDLGRILRHYSNDVVFTSPYAAERGHGAGGVVRGKDALRAYWADGLRALPGLHFTVRSVRIGVDAVVIGYRNQAGREASEVLVFRDGLIVSGLGAYGPAPA